MVRKVFPQKQRPTIKDGTKNQSPISNILERRREVVLKATLNDIFAFIFFVSSFLMITYISFNLCVFHNLHIHFYVCTILTSVLTFFIFHVEVKTMKFEILKIIYTIILSEL